MIPIDTPPGTKIIAIESAHEGTPFQITKGQIYVVDKMREFGFDTGVCVVGISHDGQEIDGWPTAMTAFYRNRFKLACGDGK